MKTPHCSICDRDGHYPFQCFSKPRKLNKLTRHLRKFDAGKSAVKWKETRLKWFEVNSPDFAGFYYCHYCGKAMTKQQTTLDHVMTRSQYPELRYDLDNLIPCCWFDNGRRGSTDYKTYCRRYYPHLLKDV